MCEYCRDYAEREQDFPGDDGIMYNRVNGKFYLVIEHFRYERCKIEINNCPMCGRKLV